MARATKQHPGPGGGHVFLMGCSFEKVSARVRREKRSSIPEPRHRRSKDLRSTSKSLSLTARLHVAIPPRVSELLGIVARQGEVFRRNPATIDRANLSLPFTPMLSLSFPLSLPLCLAPAPVHAPQRTRDAPSRL